MSIDPLALARDANPGITQPWQHCVAGMHLGRMTPQPKVGEFEAVLTVAAQPGSVEDGVRHRHAPISYPHPEDDALDLATSWVLQQLEAGRRVLIRSEGGRQRPGVIVALAVLRLGGSYFDAIRCVRHGRGDALTDCRFLELLKQADQMRRSA